MSEILTIVIVGLTLVNVGLVGLNLKLFTEYVKDKSQERRAKS